MQWHSQRQIRDGADHHYPVAILSLSLFQCQIRISICFQTWLQIVAKFEQLCCQLFHQIHQGGPFLISVANDKRSLIFNFLISRLLSLIQTKDFPLYLTKFNHLNKPPFCIFKLTCLIQFINKQSINCYIIYIN